MSATLLPELDYLRDLAAKLASAKHGEKGRLIHAAAEFLRCSKQELYRKLEKSGFESGRKTRADSGKRSVSRELAMKASGMVVIATRANEKRTLSMKDALGILKAEGKDGNVDPDTGEAQPITVSATTLARAMRDYQCHPDQLRQPTAHVQQRSLYPNHVWQIDASVCVLFYLPKGGLAAMSEKEFYKNKPANVRRIEKCRVIRYVVTDHYSGAFYVEYVTGAEDAANLTQCFLNAIQKRGANDPMHGVPEILMMDKGSANTSGLFLNLLDRLGVRYISHLPGNPRAKGQVEKTQDIVECKFEGRLQFYPVADLAELNAKANEWRLAYNATFVHTRHHRTRNAMWLTIKESQLRIAPPLELCRELVTTRPVEATVRGNLSISYAIKGYGSNEYSLAFIPGVMVKTKVQVVVNPYRAPDVDVQVKDERGEIVTYTVSPVVKNEAGFAHDAPVIGEEFKSHGDSPLDSNWKTILKDAYGAETQLEVDKKKKAKVPAFDGQLNVFADVEATPVPEYLPRRGRDLSVELAHRDVAPLTHIQAAKKLKAALGDAWTTERYQWMAQRYPDGVPESEIDGIVTQLSTDNPQRKTPLRKVVG